MRRRDGSDTGRPPPAKRARRPLAPLPVVPGGPAGVSSDVPSLAAHQRLAEEREARQRLELELKGLAARHRSEIEALVKKVSRQQSQLSAEREKNKQHRIRLSDMSLELSALRNGRDGVGTADDGGSVAAALRTETERARDLQDSNDRLGHQLNVVRGEMGLAKQEARLLQQKVARMARENERYKQQARAHAAMSARLSAAEQKNKELSSRVQAAADSERLIATYRSQLASLNSVKRNNLSLQQKLRTLEARASRVTYLEERVQSLSEREQVWEQETRRCEKSETEKGYLQHQVDAWTQSIKRTFPHVSSPADAAKEVADLWAAQRLLLKTKGELTVRERQVSAKLQAAEAEASRLSQALTDSKTHGDLLETKLRRCKLELRAAERERDSHKEMLDHYDLEDTKESHDEQRTRRIRQLESALRSARTELAKLRGVRAAGERLAAAKSSLEAKFAALQQRLVRADARTAAGESAAATSAPRMGGATAGGPRGVPVDFDPITTKVLHFTMNPQRRAVLEKQRSELAALREENARLQAKVRDYEQSLRRLGGAAVVGEGETAPTSAKSVIEMVRFKEKLQVKYTQQQKQHAAEVKRMRSDAEKLKGDLQESSKRLHRLKEVFRLKVSEFREACYRMTGYKIELVSGDKYRLRPMYAASEDDFLMIQFHNGQLSVLGTAFCERLEDSVRLLLTRFHSVPAFLSQITLDLFNQTTMQVK